MKAMKNSLLILFLFIRFNSHSQSVSGYWYGNAYVKSSTSNNNYLVELIIKQNKSKVSGILNYYFRNTFRSLNVSGNYNASKRELTLFNVPVTYFGSYDEMEVDCTMDIYANLIISEIGSNLKGLLVGKTNYRYTCLDIGMELKFHSDLRKKDSILQAIKEFKEINQVWKPRAADSLIAISIIPQKIINPVIVKEDKEREKVLAREIEVESDSISVDFYDNGEIDGDSISVFYNNDLIASHKRLSTKSTHFNLILDKDKEFNELTMFAENLGSIPPNTALMIIKDGKKYYEIRLTSTLEKSAMVRIKRKPE